MSTMREWNGHNLKVLELFSGIGGMHTALELSGIPGEVYAAVDINSVANDVYVHNFPNIKVLRKNIQKISASYVNKLGINTILMSPPCQPFTRVGNKKGLDDKRSVPLTHILNILPDLVNLRFILLENVTGFETSEAGERLRDVLKQADFEFREMMITPLQLGIPNSRERFYMIAIKKPLTFSLDIPGREDLNDVHIKTLLGNTSSPHTPSCVNEILELDENSEDYERFSLPENVLRKRAWILDIVSKTSTKTCCFTKSYTHYVEGTGSIYSPFNDAVVKSTFGKLKLLKQDSVEYLETLQLLKLRFFTPKEVQRILCFPDSFSYPDGVTKKQKYRLLGNSINVNVVSRLIRLMTNCKEL